MFWLMLLDDVSLKEKKKKKKTKVDGKKFKGLIVRNGIVVAL
jgi:hypothetical protein